MGKKRNLSGVMVQIDDEELEQALRKLADDLEAEALKAAALAGAEVIRAAAEARAPGPIEMEVVEADRAHALVEIGPDKEHWFYRFHETGAQPHEVEPSHTGGLAFPGEEGEIVRRLIEHPGLPARPFLRPAFDEQQEQATAATGAALRKVVEP